VRFACLPLCCSLAQLCTLLVLAGNVEGNRRWVDLMQWDGAEAFAAAPVTDWRVGGKSAGTARAAKGLTFLEVDAAGHMVPMDQPKASLNMLSRFMKNAAFDAALVPTGFVAYAEAAWQRLVGPLLSRMTANTLRRAGAAI